MSGHKVNAAPLDKKFLTTGVKILSALFWIGMAFGLYRFIFGLGSVTNLNDQYPFGFWIGVDVASGVALAAGGFTTAALIHHYMRKKNPEWNSNKYHSTLNMILLGGAAFGIVDHAWNGELLFRGENILTDLMLGVVITISVQVGGIVVVFAFLIIPATISATLTSRLSLQITIIWTSTVLASLAGLLFAYKYDFSIGPSIALFLGGILIITAIIVRLHGGSVLMENE